MVLVVRPEMRAQVPFQHLQDQPVYGAAWLDPMMGIVGAFLGWDASLLRESGRTLLDAEMDAPVAQEIRDVVARICDLHMWRVARGS
ncbi:hypothetical protein ACFONN_17890 [Dyella humi]|uniref:Uncharacterized protein n=1 Tax=Dyella humi TaxID=1770547 RepID=A0ABW8IEM7_9GAMM